MANACFADHLRFRPMVEPIVLLRKVSVEDDRMFLCGREPL